MSTEFVELRRPRRLRGRQLAKLRARVFAAYGRQCRPCGRSDVPLEVHHVNGDAMDNRIVTSIPDAGTEAVIERWSWQGSTLFQCPINLPLIASDS